MYFMSSVKSPMRRLMYWCIGDDIYMEGSDGALAIITENIFHVIFLYYYCVVNIFITVDMFNKFIACLDILFNPLQTMSNSCACN